MLNGDPKTATARQFKQGASEAIGAGAVQVVKDYDTPDWSPSNAQRAAPGSSAVSSSRRR